MSFDKLKEDLVGLGQIGRETPKKIETFDQLDPQHGIHREAGSKANGQARDYVTGLMEEVGLAVKVDKVGNIFGRLNGSNKEAGTVMTGSHIDSVTNGGMFDGSLGVLGAIEAVRRMENEGFDNEKAIEVVVFTAEEGSAFTPGLLGSSVLVGKLETDKALQRKNDNGVNLKTALENIGYRGDFERNLSDVTHYLEMHIEQGPVLENKDVSIGIVENITGIQWILANLEGIENHAGTTPMGMRKDALVAAAKIVLFLNNRANEMVDKQSSSTVATVGKLNVLPNGINIVPGQVEMGIDIRDIKQENMEALSSETLHFMERLEDQMEIYIETDIPLTHNPVPCSAELVDRLVKSAREEDIEAILMDSGAGHDAQNMAEKVKTGMIFVPTIDGISHSPMEWVNWEDVKLGTRILTRTLKNLAKPD